MSLNNRQYIITKINPKYNKQNQKLNMRNLSPNIKIFNSQQKKVIQNELFPKNNNFNIKVNKIHLKKEKIIEGELNFEDNNKQKYYLINNKNKNKPKKRIPNKSPIPIRGTYKSKDLLSFNKLFNSTNKLNRMHNNINNPNNININNNFFNQNQNTINNFIFSNNINFSKTFNSFYKKNDRSHTPILRTNNKLTMNLGNNKINRKENKSPILGKSFNFRKNEKYKLMNNNNNNNIINNNILFKNNFRFNNKNINVVNINLRPISHNNLYNNNFKNKINLYDDEINMDILRNNNFNHDLNNNNNVVKIIKNNINSNITNNKSNNKKIQRPKSPKNNPDKKNLRNNKNHIIINDNEINNNNLKDNKILIKEEPNLQNNKIEEKNIKEINNNQKDEIAQNQIKKKESPKAKKNMQSSHSQSNINPLQNLSSKKREKEKEINIEEKPIIKPNNSKIIKKIKDIYEYSHVGFDGEEPKENNQDNYFIFKNFINNKDYIYMAVCDGHGVEGHFVSDFIKDVLPYYMSENLKSTNILENKEITHQIITETFLLVNNMLVMNENINSLFSGSTCISVIYTPERLIVPNIGDSRAVLARYDNVSKEYKAIELSRDHKPTEKDEAKRIYENDGRIQPFTEEGEFVGPQRVWLKEEEVPGLAMTRSFGDRVAATVGVISEPEIKEFEFNENDKFMIIASDGIWEFISSQECVNIVGEFYEKNDLKGCAEYLYEESSKRWLKEEEVIDDTTLILVFFE